MINSATLLTLWNRLSSFPGGRFIFSKLIGFLVPYSGSICPKVVTLKPGVAEVILPDRRSNRNHLRSLHAIALTNVAEIASGLAILTAIPPNAQGILRGFEIQFQKKARGPIRASTQIPVPVEVSEAIEMRVPVELKDASNDVVVTAVATWRLRQKSST